MRRSENNGDYEVFEDMGSSEPEVEDGVMDSLDSALARVAAGALAGTDDNDGRYNNMNE
jgi:hypothetical protein